MANEYYADPTGQIPLSVVRSSDYNDNNSAITAGFDKLPAPADFTLNTLDTDVSTVNTLYNVTSAFLPNPLTIGYRVRFNAILTSAVNAKISVNATTQYNLVNNAGANIVEKDIVAGSIVECTFNGTQYQLLHPSETNDNITLIYEGNWVEAASIPISVAKSGNVILIDGKTNGGDLANGTIFTLPVGYRPKQQTDVIFESLLTGSLHQVRIFIDGRVSYRHNSFVGNQRDNTTVAYSLHAVFYAEV